MQFTCDFCSSRDDLSVIGLQQTRTINVPIFHSHQDYPQDHQDNDQRITAIWTGQIDEISSNSMFSVAMCEVNYVVSSARMSGSSRRGILYAYIIFLCLCLYKILLVWDHLQVISD